MIKWFRFHSFCGFILTAFLWIFLCYQVLSRSGSLDENDAFNLVEEIVIEDIKEAPPDFHFVSAETKYTEQGRKAKKYKVVDKAHEDKPLTYEAFLTKLETNDDFLDDFVDVLRRGLQSFSDMDMTPYFFETPPVTLETLNSTVFEFVLVAAREFNQALPSPGNFQKYLKKCTDGVVSFSNLGKDAILIVPCQLAHESPNPYTHLANFIRLGNERQIKLFWQEVARQMQKRLRVKQGKKVWISTCGLGVFWLHVRLDTSPKYYSYTAYRNA